MTNSITEQTVQRLLDQLAAAVNDIPDFAPDDLLNFVIICCERTRDIRLFGASPNSVSPELTQTIANVFETTYQAIINLDLENHTQDQKDQINEYAKNILGRTMIFRELAGQNTVAEEPLA